MDDPLADLRAKLKARENKAGMGANVNAIRAAIEEAEDAGFVHRNARDGRFVSAEYAAEHPDTTFKQKVS